MLVDDVALSLESKVNYSTAIHLLDCFLSAEAIYNASEEELVSRAELNPLIAKCLIRKDFHSKAEKEVAFAQKNGINIIVSTSEQYPESLKECVDYPHVMYLKGDTSLLNSKMLTMVGTRNVSSYGLKVCDRFVAGLAELVPDLVIVSGLAYGIDVACHRAALANKLRTIAVQAVPLTGIYPSHHTSIARDMVTKGGGILSELYSGAVVNKARFIQRNRILAGLSQGTVVVQSPLVGGAMVTANLADGYNRMVMAPPASISEMGSEGTNSLLRRMKARIVCSAYDIVQEMGWYIDSGKKSDTVMSDGLGKDQRGLFDCMEYEHEYTLDELTGITGLVLQELLTILLELEFAGAVRMLPGDRYEKM